MLRAVLLGLLSLSAVSCKSHDESQAKSQPGVAAGKVIEVTGTVTLHHGTETRPLAKGDMVDADDIVETGADGSAVIEVQHNNVNWEIGANKTGCTGWIDKDTFSIRAAVTLCSHHRRQVILLPIPTKYA